MNKWILASVVLLFAITMVAQQQSNQFDSSSAMPTAEMQQQQPTMANDQVLYDIQSQLSTNPRLNSTQVTATVTDDSVILSGYASNEQERETALGIAEQFTDSRNVVDHIQVGGLPRD